jgi:hypothetical protein
MNGVITLVLVALGCSLIALGTYMSWKDWDRKNRLVKTNNPNSIDKTITALAKLLEAMKDYPLGQQLIVWGIIVLVIAGLFGGISGLG